MNLDRDYILAGLIVIAFIASRIPFIGKFFRVANTLIHESGHAFVALLTSADVLSIELFADTSGSATTQTSNKFSRFVTAIAGYIFSSGMAFFLFYLIKYEWYLWVLFIFGVLALLNLILFIRNIYGIIWLISFVAVLSALYYFRTPAILFYSTTLISGIVLTDSLYSALLLVKIAFKNSNASGDAKNLEKLTLIPAFFWTLLFALQALFFTYLTICLFVPKLNFLTN